MPFNPTLKSPFPIIQERKESPPCGTCKSECCHFVPMTRVEINGLLQWMFVNLDHDYILKLRDQPREQGMCPFVDTEKWQCSVYPVRPTICKDFAYSKGMVCSYAPQLATEPASKAFLNFAHEHSIYSKEDLDKAEVTLVGSLFTWADITLETKEGENDLEL